MKYLIIANEFSGTDKGCRILKEVEEYLTFKKISFITWKTKYSGHAKILAAKAAEEGFEEIWAIGGDGTFNEIINGLEFYNNISLAVIPAGSGNDFIKNTNIKGSVPQMIDYILNTTPSLVDCGIVNGNKFLNICGFGLDVDLAMTQAKIKKLFKGNLSYYIALIISILTIKFRNIKYYIDDNEPIECSSVLIAVSNGTSYGGGLPITPKATIQDGLLDVCVIRKLSYFKIPSLLLKFLKGKHISDKKHVDYYKCRKVRIESNYSIPLNVDGELILKPPCDFEIIPKSMKIYI